MTMLTIFRGFVGTACTMYVHGNNSAGQRKESIRRWSRICRSIRTGLDWRYGGDIKFQITWRKHVRSIFR